MTHDALTAAAIANRQKSLTQLAALRPLVKPAQERAEQLREGVKRAKTAGESARFITQRIGQLSFHPTPAAVVARMIERARITSGLRILEPSAGAGAIAQPLTAAGCAVYCVELAQGLAERLRAAGLAVQQADFLALTLHDFSMAEGVGGFDRVLMNPPFERGADVQHVRHALTFLRPGGLLVAICANGPRQSAELQPLADSWEVLPAGTFRNSGTNVGTVLLTISR
jgi:2-polyprenyl-3-methyl-5-hydroxy-6-metoxy-1,4-benzoquinol methylase